LGFLILLSGVRNVLRAVAWSYCVQTRGRRPAWLELFGPRLVAEALNDSVPAGPLLGETAKVVGISRLIAGRAAAASVVIEDLTYALAALLFMLSGVVLALLKLATPYTFRWVAGGLVICLLGSTLLACWIIGRRIVLVSGTLDYLKRAGLRWDLLERHYNSLRQMEQDIHDFFLARRSLFLFVLAVEFASNLTGIGEAYLILKITASHASLFAAYLVESANRAVQLGFAFVPFGLGVQEGVAAATLEALGYAASEGVSLAILRKIRTFFWDALGLLLAAGYSIGRSPREEHSI
jgi:Lysylphosphatidylglycerol synthase TM region